jgi:hypothetical protein
MIRQIGTEDVETVLAQADALFCSDCSAATDLLNDVSALPWS